jgi:hypothetical protein
MELENYVAEKHKACLKGLYGMLELDEQFYSQREKIELMSELEHRNLKNKMLMETYIHRS